MATMPIVHMNGTSRAELVRLNADAQVAAITLLERLKDAAPHARDYYPLGDEAFRKASEEHRQRLKNVQQVIDDLQAIQIHVIG